MTKKMLKEQKLKSHSPIEPFFRCVLIDDEESSIQVMKAILDRFSKDVEIVGVANSIKQAIEVIKSTQPNLLFLDIELPDGKSFDLIHQIDTSKFQLIFATAFNQYAIQALKAGAVDYLLKPIVIEDVLASIKRAKSSLSSIEYLAKKHKVLEENMQKEVIDKIVVANQNEYVILKIEDIVRIEASGSYSTLFMSNGERVVASKMIKEYDELLASNNFFRLHQSHLINVNYFKKYIKSSGGTVIMKDDTEIPVARQRKKGLILELQKYM